MSFMDALCENLIDREAPELSAARLEELKAAALPHATCADVGLNVKCSDPAQEAEAKKAIEELNAYFKAFVVGACPNCKRLHGFSWGFRHGEGACRCGYPARAIHDLGDFGKLSNLILFYHPEELEGGARPADQAGTD